MPRASTPGPPDALDARIDRLYALPLDRFVAERNSLAAALKREGRAADSARVKDLTRPTLPAWALNQVYWHARGDYDRLTQAGDRMREVQRQALGGRDVDVREPTRQRQQAVRGVVDRAVSLMRAAGQTVTDATRQRIGVVADTIAAYGSRPREYTPGRMERELDPPGFEALAGLAGPAPQAPPLRLVKSEKDARPAVRKAPSEGATRGQKRDRRSEQEAQARAAESEVARQRKEALARAKLTLENRERDLERARRTEEAAAARLKELRREADALRRRLDTLERRMQDVEAEVEAARARVRESTAAADESRREVRELE